MPKIGVSTHHLSWWCRLMRRQQTNMVPAPPLAWTDMANRVHIVPTDHQYSNRLDTCNQLEVAKEAKTIHPNPRPGTESNH